MKAKLINALVTAAKILSPLPYTIAWAQGDTHPSHSLHTSGKGIIKGVYALGNLGGHFRVPPTTREYQYLDL